MGSEFQEVTEAAIIPDACHGQRLDQAVAEMFPQFSRARLQQWIKSGQLLIDGAQLRPKSKVLGGERVVINAQLEAEGEWVANEISLDIVYEDDHILVVNKPIGLVVHPAAGHRSHTLLNALVHHCPNQRSLPRGGIVHRLDKDTSGLMVVAKSLMAHTSLVNQLKEKSVLREYVAIVNGVVRIGGMVDKPIGRHPTHRIKMAVVESGKPAVTHYKVLQRFSAHSLLQLNLETGRTHQIRVHMASLRHPIVGDPLYGGRPVIPKQGDAELTEALQRYPCQALHARKLSFDHPNTAEPVQFESSIRCDMAALLNKLKGVSH